MKLVLRKLKGYKYTVELPYSRDVDLHREIDHEYMTWKHNILTIKQTYAYDGASGPTFDDKTNLKPALMHDAQYQLMREGIINRKHRKTVDKTFRRHCLEDGMGKIRAWFYYKGARLRGKKHTFPRKHPRGQIIEI